MGMIPRSPDVPIGADEDRRPGPASYSSGMDRERMTRDKYQGVRDGAAVAIAAASCARVLTGQAAGQATGQELRAERL